MVPLVDMDEPSRWLRRLLLPSRGECSSSDDTFTRVVCAFGGREEKVLVGGLTLLFLQVALHFMDEAKLLSHLLLLLFKY